MRCDEGAMRHDVVVCMLAAGVVNMRVPEVQRYPYNRIRSPVLF